MFCKYDFLWDMGREELVGLAVSNVPAGVFPFVSQKPRQRTPEPNPLHPVCQYNKLESSSYFFHTYDSTPSWSATYK